MIKRILNWAPGFWAILFLLVPIGGVLTFVLAPSYRIWLPQDVSEHGRVIDGLFMFILYLTGVVFIATECVMFYFLWKYSEKKTTEPVAFSHGSHSLEVVWTIIPAVTLLFIAIYQMDAWAANKMRAPEMAPTCEVTGRQFNWDFRYPGPDGELYTADDIVRTDGKLYLPYGEEVLLKITSADVLHSFFLPNLRLKQDVVPGMVQSMWFKATEGGSFDIVCAELCGWGHYKMKGEITLLPRPEYEKKLEELRADANTSTVAVPAGN
ncbi:MAG: cytochrome c oxidase subunit II [Pirellulales bacterium]|nr:cytochrome c oxidase subunit II [Pirellulales bacterium]MBX3432897.1 cytochrome c oxidase subunit II [Pirellulales bacterium]